MNTGIRSLTGNDLRFGGGSYCNHNLVMMYHNPCVMIRWHLRVYKDQISWEIVKCLGE